MYGHLFPITKIIQIGQADHCWGSKDEVKKGRSPCTLNMDMAVLTVQPELIHISSVQILDAV